MDNYPALGSQLGQIHEAFIHRWKNIDLILPGKYTICYTDGAGPTTAGLPQQQAPAAGHHRPCISMHSHVHLQALCSCQAGLPSADQHHHQGRLAQELGTPITPQPRGPMDPGTQHISSTGEGNGFSVWLSHLLLKIQDKVISVTLTFLLGPPLLYLTEGNSIPFGLPCWVWFGLVNVGNLSWAYMDVCQTDTKNSNTELQRSPIGQCNKEDHCPWSAAGPAATCSPSPETEAQEPPHLPHLHAKGTRAAHTPSLSFWCGLPASEPQPLLLAQAQPVVAVPPEQLSFNRATDLSMTRSSQTVMHSAAMNC